MRTLTCAPNVEVFGMYLIAYLENLQSTETTPIMEKYGLLNPEPHQWYPAHKWVSALNELNKHPNISENLVAIGIEIGKLVPIPPDIDLEHFLMGLDGAYQASHRNGDAGHFMVEKLGDKHYTISITDMYPDDLNYGIIYTLARRLLPSGITFKVYYDKQIVPRDDGGKGATVIHLNWQ